jgi:hypothetical protein
MMHAYLCYDTRDPEHDDLEAASPTDAQGDGVEEIEGTLHGSFPEAFDREERAHYCLFPGCEVYFNKRDVLVSHMRTHFKVSHQTVKSWSLY